MAKSRSRLINFRVDPETEEQMDILAQELDGNKSLLFRLLIRHKYAAKYPEDTRFGVTKLGRTALDEAKKE